MNDRPFTQARSMSRSPSRSTRQALMLLSCLLPLPAAAQLRSDDLSPLRLPELAQVDGRATSTSVDAAMTAAPAPRRFLGIVGIGLVQGLANDVVVDEYRGRNGNRQRRYHAGNAMVAQLGAEWRLDSPWSVQLSTGIYSESLIFVGGTITSGAFVRNHVEGLAHYRVLPWLRFGAGLRFNYNARLRPGGSNSEDYSDHRIRYRNNVAPVLEAEFWSNRRVSMKVRLGHERFRPRDGGPEVNADHAGLIVNVNL